MNLIETNKVLAIIREGWPNHPWAENIDRVWQMGLDDVTYAEVEAILPTLFKTQRFAPVPADVRELLGVNVSQADEWDAQLPNGDQAFEEVTREIRRVGSWGTPKFSHALIERTVAAFGWDEICGCELDQMNTLRAQIERFHNQYRNDAIAALKRGVPMETAVLPFGEQKRIAGLVPVALAEVNE